jgi:hypothetical protein
MTISRPTEISPEELDRLANRVAQLVGYDQDADNAGRAIGAMARRLGLSGDNLRQWLVAGALLQTGQNSEAEIIPPDRSVAGRLERALANSEHSLRVVEAQLRHTQSERDALKEENALLIASLDRARSAEQVRRYLGFAVVAAAILGAVVLTAGPTLRPMATGQQTRPFGSPFLRSGVIRANGTTVYRVPQVTGMVITQLTAGTRVQVRQTVERDQVHWIEVEVGGVAGYVVSTDIDVADPNMR